MSSELKSEIEKNKDKFVGNLNLQPQDTALFLNGLFFDMDITDIMTILESIKSEQKIMEGLYSIGESLYSSLMKKCKYLMHQRGATLEVENFLKFIKVQKCKRIFFFSSNLLK